MLARKMMIEPSTNLTHGSILLRDPDSPGWMRFASPRAVHIAHHPSEIPALLTEIREQTELGRWAAGFLCYEAAAAFDPAFATHPPLANLPLAWFGIFDAPGFLAELPLRHEVPPPRLEICRPLDRDTFTANVEAIRQCTERGETYQANYTSMLQGTLHGDASALFAAMYEAQPTPNAALISLPEWTICCASPELFFEQREGLVRTRPMKGTRHRGRWADEDRAMGDQLLASEKDRAENVMIVDLLRNDLGHIARSSSVRVESLFDLERYPTVWQLTSTIAARTGAHPVETLAALFPCGSITGAPKIETMRILRGLEQGPRGVYTGAIGWFGPEQTARFNVAIRTALVRRADQTVFYGVGGGITWASDPETEFQEAQLKSRVLSHAPQFQLLEALRHDPDQGWWLLEGHIERLRDSAEYFDFAFDEAALRSLLAQWAASLPLEPVKARLVMHRDGRIELSHAFIGLPSGASDRQTASTHPPVVLQMASTPVDSSDIFLFHKTTRRTVYERAATECPDADDVLLWNERGELTESSRANLVVETSDGRLLTPQRACGLLAGVFRENLLRREEISEAIIRKTDLTTARRLWLINSVRQWMPAELSDRACRMGGKQAPVSAKPAVLREDTGRPV